MAATLWTQRKLGDERPSLRAARHADSWSGLEDGGNERAVCTQEDRGPFGVSMQKHA